MLPVELPDRFMTVADLGSPVDVYSMAKWKLALLALVSVAFLAGSIASPFLAKAAAFEMVREWYVATGVFAMVAVVAGALAWIRSRNVIAVYEDGFAWAKGNRITSYRWDGIAAMTSAVTKMSVNFIPAGTTHRHTLDLISGDRIVLTNDKIGRVGQLADHIRGQIMPRLFEQAAETYNRGEEVEFGPVTIGRDIGIQHGKKHLTWDEVESVGAGDGELQLRKRDGGAFSHIRIAISTVPNFEALYMMLEQVLGLGQEPE